jgi:hypothetical protein
VGEKQYNVPESIDAAIRRKRVLESDIWSIERQLSSHEESNIAAYKNWRAKAHTSLIHKKGEQAFLKDWITSRRRQVAAHEAGVFEPDSPNELLLRVHAEIKRHLDGKPNQLPALYNLIDQYLHHTA